MSFYETITQVYERKGRYRPNKQLMNLLLQYLTVKMIVVFQAGHASVNQSPVPGGVAPTLRDYILSHN